MIDRAMHASAPGSGSVGGAEPRPWRDPARSDARSAPDPGPPKTWIASKVARFLLSVSVVVIASVVTLLVGEMFVRFFAPTERLVPLNEVISGITAERANVGGVHVVPYTFHVSYTTNSQRFRARREYTSFPDPHVLRVAVVGDSFTFGWGANDDQSYPNRLERLLNNKLGSTEVINAGVCGTGTGNEALWYDFWVNRFHPNLVILTVVPNDVDDDLARPLFSIDASGNVGPKSMVDVDKLQAQTVTARSLITRMPLYDYLTEHSELLNLFRRTVSLLIRRHNIEQTSAKAGASAFDTIGLRLLGGEVEWLNQRVHSAGAQLIVVFVPFTETVYGQAPTTNKVVRDSLAMVGTLAQVCEKNSIPFRDLTTEMRRTAAEGHRPLFYTRYDAHPTPEGYQVIADLVSPLVVDEIHAHAQNFSGLQEAK